MAVLKAAIQKEAKYFQTFRNHYLVFAIHENKHLAKYSFLNYPEFLEALYKLPPRGGRAALEIKKHVNLFVETKELDKAVEFSICFRKNRYEKAVEDSPSTKILEEIRDYIQTQDEQADLGLMELKLTFPTTY